MSFPKVTRFGADPLLDQELATKAYVDQGGGDGAQVVGLIADFVKVSDTVLETVFSLAVEAGKRYGFYIWLTAQSNTTADWKHNYAAPSGTVGRKNVAGWSGGITAQVDLFLQTVIAAGPNVDNMTFQGGFTVGGTNGLFEFQLAQNFSNINPTTVFANSLMLLWEQTLI